MYLTLFETTYVYIMKHLKFHTYYWKCDITDTNKPHDKSIISMSAIGITESAGSAFYTIQLYILGGESIEFIFFSGRPGKRTSV